MSMPIPVIAATTGLAPDVIAEHLAEHIDRTFTPYSVPTDVAEAYVAGRRRGQRRQQLLEQAHGEYRRQREEERNEGCRAEYQRVLKLQEKGITSKYRGKQAGLLSMSVARFYDEDDPEMQRAEDREKKEEALAAAQVFLDEYEAKHPALGLHEWLNTREGEKAARGIDQRLENEAKAGVPA